MAVFLLKSFCFSSKYECFIKTNKHTIFIPVQGTTFLLNKKIFYFRVSNTYVKKDLVRLTKRLVIWANQNFSEVTRIYQNSVQDNKISG